MSIVPKDETKNKVSIQLKNKVTEMDLDSRVKLIPLKTYSDIENEKEIKNLKLKLLESEKKNSDYESKLFGNELQKRNKHLEYILEQYKIICLKENKKIQLINCSNNILKGICNSNCQILNKYLKDRKLI